MQLITEIVLLLVTSRIFCSPETAVSLLPEKLWRSCVSGVDILNVACDKKVRLPNPLERSSDPLEDLHEQHHDVSSSGEMIAVALDGFVGIAPVLS